MIGYHLRLVEPELAELLSAYCRSLRLHGQAAWATWYVCDGYCEERILETVVFIGYPDGVDRIPLWRTEA